MTRVAIVGIKHLPASAGADRVVERLLEHDAGLNSYVVYLLRESGETAPCTATRRYIYVPAPRGKHLRAFSYFLLCTLHLLVKVKCEVVHVHNSDFGFFTPLFKLKPGVRIIGTFHGDPYKRAKWRLPARILLRLSEWLFVRSCDVLTSVSAEKVASGHDIRYIPNGVDRLDQVDREQDSTFCERLGVRRGQYGLFACGRLDSTKGLHHLLSAYRDLPEPEKLLVIGDFSHDPAYSRLVEKVASRDSRVVLHRSLLNREALFKTIQSCAVFVFPSEVEAMSMVLLEALACGPPVVCSNIPANVAVVGQDYPFLFRSKDVASLGGAMRTALHSPERSVELADVANRLAAEFRWDVIAGQYQRLYEGCAAG